MASPASASARLAMLQATTKPLTSRDDELLIAAKFGNSVQAVVLSRAELAKGGLPFFRAGVLKAHPSSSPDSEIFFLMPSSSSIVGVSETRLEDAADIATLRSGDQVIIRAPMKRAGLPPPPLEALASPLSARRTEGVSSPVAAVSSAISSTISNSTISSPTSGSTVAVGSSSSSNSSSVAQPQPALSASTAFSRGDASAVFDAAGLHAAGPSTSRRVCIGRADERPTELGATPPRAVGLRDVLDGRVPDSVYGAAAAITQKDMLSHCPNLSPIKLPGASHVGGFVLGTAGWATASTVVLVLPAAGCAPGVWSAAVAVLVGTGPASMTEFVQGLTTTAAPVDSSNSGTGTTATALSPVSASGRATVSPAPALRKGSVGVLLLDPHAGGRSPGAHIAAVCLALLGPASGAIGGNPSCGIVLVTHGSGSDHSVGLLFDAAFRPRVKGLAFISPTQPPRQSVQAAVYAGGGRSTAATVRTLLRQRAIAWEAQLTPISHTSALAAAAAASSPAAAASLILTPVPCGLQPPYLSDDYGCTVAPFGVALPGLAAHREEAAEVLSGLAPSLVTPSILAFIHALAESPIILPADSEPAIAWANVSLRTLLAEAKAAEAAAAAQLASPVTLPGAVEEEAEEESDRTPLLKKAAGAAAVDVATAPAADAAATSVAATAAATAPPSAFIPPPPIAAPYAEIATRALTRFQALHVSAFAPGGGGEWKETGVSSGVRTYTQGDKPSRPADASPDEPFVGGRGDSVLAFPVSVLHALLLDPAVRYELDAQLDKVTPIADQGLQSRIERLMFKGVFPTDPRDFCTLVSWSVTEEGVLYFCATSVEHPSVPTIKGYVRGKLDIGGWVATPLSERDYISAAGALGLKPAPGPFRGACRVSYIFRTSIGGSVPRFVVQQVTGAQATLPARVSAMLTKKYAKGIPAPLLIPLMNTAVEGAATAPAAGAAAEEKGAVPAAVTAEDPSPSTPTDVVTAEGNAAGAVPCTYTFNLSGTWKLDKAKSTPLDELLREMGVPWVARKIAESLDITSVAAHTASALTLTESSSLGGATTVLTLDWVARTVKGSDGKTISQRAVALAGVDAVGDAWEEVVSKHLSSPPPVAPTPAFGPGSGCIVTHTVLPDALGSTRDERFLVSPNTMRLVTVYTKGGVIKARLERYLRRWDAVTVAFVADKDAPAIVPVAGAVVASTTASAGGAEAPVPVPATESTPVKAAASSVAPAQISTTPTAAVTVAANAPSTPNPTTTSPVAAAVTPSLRLPAEQKAATPSAPAPSLPVEKTTVIFFPPGARPNPAGHRWSYDKWCPDDDAIACAACARPFTALTRRHHCRSCGDNFCDTCSSARSPLSHFTTAQQKAAKVGPNDAVRLCSPCAAPFVASLSPATLPTRGGRVEITGGHLGTPELLSAGRVAVIISPITSSAAVGAPVAVAAASPQRIRRVRAKRVVVTSSNTALAFDMPPGAGNVEITLEVDGRKSAAAVPFAYIAPTIAAVGSAASSVDVDTDGGPVLVTGDNLGAFDADVAIALSFSVGGIDCTAGARLITPHTSVLVVVPPGAGSSELAVVRRGVAGGAEVVEAPSVCAFTYAAPAVFSTRVAEDGSVIVYGRSLGGSDALRVVTLGGVECTCSVLVPHAKLRLLPAASTVAALRKGTALPLAITVGGLPAAEAFSAVA